MPTKFVWTNLTQNFQVRLPKGGWTRTPYHGLAVWLESHRAYRRYSPSAVAFATQLDRFWRQNAGIGWDWEDSIDSVGHHYLKGVGYPRDERGRYTKAKEIIREGFFGLQYEDHGILYAYATTRGSNALSGYVDKASTAVVYDERNHRMLRLMNDRVEHGTVEPAAAAFGVPIKTKRPVIKTLK